MAAPMSKSMASMRQILAVVSIQNSRFGLHTSCRDLLRKRRGSVEKFSGTRNEADLLESFSNPYPAESYGASANVPPGLEGQDGVRNRRTLEKARGPHHEKTVKKRQSMIEISQDDDMKGANIPRYTKAGPDDKRLGRATMLAKSRKYREKSGKIILEGRRLIADALESGAKPDTIFFSQASNIEGLPLDDLKVNLVKVAYKDISLWSDVSTPQGIVGVFRRPRYENIGIDQYAGEQLPVSLICDNIRDPGNLGTILRSAAAAACNKILLTKGCVDAWEPKVLRSGAGAHFRVPIISNIPWDSIPNYLPSNRSVHIADCNHVQDADLLTPSDSTAPDDQSNYAWEAEVSDEDIAEDYSNDEGNKATIIRTVPYFSVNWTQGDCAIVIGGETEGLCKEAEELCTETGGRRIFIPMSMGVNSLNAAMATSVILFEAKRQLLMSKNS